MGLKSNQKVVGYPHSVCATTAFIETSCHYCSSQGSQMDKTWQLPASGSPLLLPITSKEPPNTMRTNGHILKLPHANLLTSILVFPNCSSANAKKEAEARNEGW